MKFFKFLPFVLVSSLFSINERNENDRAIINAINEKDILPGNFRMTKVIPLSKDAKVNTQGLEQLYLSGSGQFSDLGLEAINKRIGFKSMVILNLRSEDEGLIEPEKGSGGIAFSYQPQWPKRSLDEIELSEEEKMATISQKKKLLVQGAENSVLEIDVKRALTEKQLVEEKGMRYFRIPDKGFGDLDPKQVDLFVEFSKTIGDQEWLHIHCRDGLERTTIFMVMYDMLHNSDNASAEELIKRQGPSSLGGFNLFSSPDIRLFLYRFYYYVKACKPDQFSKSFSQWLEEQDVSNRVLVLNTLDEGQSTIQNFRSSKDRWLDDSVKFKKDGLDEINFSGSSQYTKSSLKKLLEKLRPHSSKIVIVDLRPDDHIFVNGHNISSFERKDTLLASKSAKDIKKSKEDLKKYLSTQNRIEVHAIDSKYPRNSYDDRLSMEIVPKEIETPEEMVTNSGAKYLLIGNNRFSDVADENVDQFISYWKELPADTWYHFHCRKGKSRTTLFMAIFDMMQNADKLKFEEIVLRQKLMGGSDLFDVTPKEPGWAEEKNSKKAWIVFLARFHQYAKENKDSRFAKSWTEWSQEHSDYQPNIDHLAIDRKVSRP